MDDLTSFQRDLLYVIAGLDAPHGLKIKTELEAYYPTEVNHGRLYPNLDTLVEKDLINKSQKDDRTNEYTVTQHGASVIEARNAWVAEYRDQQR